MDLGHVLTLALCIVGVLSLPSTHETPEIESPVRVSSPSVLCNISFRFAKHDYLHCTISHYITYNPLTRFVFSVVDSVASFEHGEC